MTQKLQIYLIMILFISSGCSTNTLNYHDSALYDRNKPSDKFNIPTDYNQLTQSELSRKAELDYLFINSDLIGNESNKDQIKNLQWMLEKEPQSIVLLQKISLEFYQKGDFQQSLSYIEKALKYEPKHKENLMLQGSILMTLKNFSQAEQVYLKLSKLYPEDSEPFLYLGAVYSEKNKFDKAYSYFSKVIELNNYDQKHLPYYYRARSILDAQNFKKLASAKKDLEKCFEIKSDFLEAVQIYANIIEKTEGKNKVFAFYESYQKKYGPIGKIAEVLAQYFIEKNDFNKAFEQLLVVEKTSDDTINAKLKISLILIDRKKFDEAKTRLEELIQIVPESDKIRFYLAAVYESTQDSDKALINYKKIDSTSQYFEDSRSRIAFLLKNQNQFEKAAEYLNEAIAIKPTVQLYLAQAQTYEEAKNFNFALESLDQALKLEQKNSMIYYYKGAINDKLNKKDLVIHNMKQALQFDDKNVQALNYLAYTYSEMNQNLDEAEKLAIKAIKIQNDDPYIIDTLGWIYYQKNEFAKAAQLLEKAFKIMPKAPIIAEHLGDVYMKLNRENKAREFYLKAKEEESDHLKIKELDQKISLTEDLIKKRLPASVDDINGNQ